MKNQPLRPFPGSSLLPAVTAALAAAGLVSTAHAQLEIAGDLLINVDATTAAPGPVTSLPNTGTLGGVFESSAPPMIAPVSGNGTLGMRFDGGQFLQHMDMAGGAIVPAAETLVGANPSCSIEAWVLNPGIAQEETVVAWGHRGGTPDGSNMSFNYGWDARWGAVGHWGGADIGWDPCCNDGSNPPGTPRGGLWHHLVYTYDGTTQRVYADGVLKNSENVTLSIFSGPPVTIGAQWANPTTVEPGLRANMTIARVRVHSEALSDAQVANNYSLEAGDFDDGGSPLASGPANRYSFSHPGGMNGTGDGAPIEDLVGDADGTVLGAGATFNGTELVLPGGSSGTAAYVDLPNGALSSRSADNGGPGAISIEGWFRNTGNHNWARIFDFGSSDVADPGLIGGEVTGPGGGGEGLDYFFLSAQEGGNINRRQVDIRNNDPVGGEDPPGPAYDSGVANRDLHFVVTWDEATGQVLTYESGALVATFSAGTNRFSNINDVNVWLGRSNWTGDGNAQGEYDEFRIYDRILTAAEVRGSFEAGPDVVPTGDPVTIVGEPLDRTVGELADTTLSVSVQGATPISLQWYRDGVAVPGANGTSLTLTSLLPSDNGTELFVVASNFVDGTAYTATSAVATVTVQDLEPPTLVSVRAVANNQIEVIFSEAIHPDDAANPALYVLSGTNAPSVTAAEFGGDFDRVILTLDGSLTDCAYFTLAVTGVRDASSNANEIEAGAEDSFWFFSSPNLEHRYSFNAPPSSDAANTVIPDLVGDADGMVLGAGATLTGSRVALPGGSSGTAAYVDLPNGLLSKHGTNNAGSGQVTFEGWFKVTGSRGWSRILDFGSSGTAGGGAEINGPGGSGEGADYLFYSAQIGDNVNSRRIDVTDRPSSIGGGAEYGVANFNQDVHFALTWDEQSGELVIYENGVRAASFLTPASISQIDDVNVWLGRSNWTQDGNLQGEFDEFRVYDRVLAPGEVTFNRAAGPDNDLGAALSLAIVATNTTFFTNTAHTIPVIVDFETAGEVDVSALQCVVFESSDSNVVVLSTGGTLQALNAGTATVTARFAHLEASVEVEVVEDSIPPELLGARVVGNRFIEVIFSEPLDPGSGSEFFSYEVSSPSIPVFTVEDAELAGDGSRVLLRLAEAMPCEEITVTVNGVTDPAGNPVADGSTARFTYFEQPGLIARYTFNQSSNTVTAGATVIDAVGTEDGMVLGAGARFTGDRVVLPGGASATTAYVDLPNGLLSRNGALNGGSGEFTFETWVKVTGTANWGRIFDFGDSGPANSAGSEVIGPGGGGEGRDYLMLSATIGTDANNRRLELRNESPPGGGIRTVDHGTGTFNQDVHIVVTWDEEAGVIRTYENGTQVSELLNLDDRMSDVNDVNVWLGRSNWTGDANMQGEFDEARFYNRVLTPEDIAFNAMLGPDNAIGSPLAIHITGPENMEVGQMLPALVSGDFTTHSNLNLTGTGCYTLESSNPSVVSNDASGVLHALSAGSAEITVNFSGLSDVITVTVGGGGGEEPVITHTVADGVITLSWEAGFRLQCTTSLTPPIEWQDVDTGGATTYTVDPNNEFDIILDPEQAGGAGRTGSGRGTATLSGNTLTVDVTYSGLSGDRSNSHFHAPGARGVSAGVAYGTQDIATGTTSGTIQGTITLADGTYGGKTIAQQLEDLRGSLWYLNIHSTTFGGGEIRGQVDPASMRFYRLIEE